MGPVLLDGVRPVKMTDMGDTALAESLGLFHSRKACFFSLRIMSEEEKQWDGVRSVRTLQPAELGLGLPWLLYIVGSVPHCLFAHLRMKNVNHR